MKRFKFRLQKVLDLRLSEKEQKRAGVLVANQRLQEAETHLSQLEDAQRRHPSPHEGIHKAQELLMFGFFADGIEQRIIDQRGIIVIRQEELDKATEEYIEASREARAIEILKERKLQEHREYQDQAERAYLDELAVQRAGRKTAGE